MLKVKTEENPQREMPFTGHLEELRGHIMRAILYVCVFSCVAWYYYDPIYDLVSTPLLKAFANAGYNPHMVFLDIMEPLLFKLQVVLAASVVFSLPFVIFEVWRFVAPGLYQDERVFVQPLLPFSILLCFAGFSLIYFALPLAFEFLLKFAPRPGEGADAELMQHLQKYFFFLLRMMICAGVVFQTPIVMLLLGQLELVTARGLLLVWRHAILICFTIAAIITPTIDPFNMSIIAVPLVGLYFLSVVLVWYVERKRARAERRKGDTPPKNDGPGDVPALPPPDPTPPAIAAAIAAPEPEPAAAPVAELPPPPLPVSGGAPIVDRSALGPLAAPEAEEQPQANGPAPEDDLGNGLEEAIDEALFDPSEPTD